MKNLTNKEKSMQEFKSNQIVTCNLTFQAEILKVHNDLQLIEFKSLTDGNRYLLTINCFKKLVQKKAGIKIKFLLF